MKLFFSLLFIFLSFTSGATTYYFSAAGNDGNSGTSQGSPYLTITKYNALVLVAGDSVLFRRGDIFYGGMVPTHSGSAGSPIYTGAYGTGAQPVITGFRTISAWTNIGGNIWESTSAVPNGPDLVNYVTIGGVNRAMGRFPNPGSTTSPVQQLGCIQFQSHSGLQQVTTSGLTGTPNWTGADIVIRINQFIWVRDSITSQSSGTINYMLGTGLPYRNGLDYTPVNNAGLFIQNDIRTLDTANEWFYNRSTKKLSVYSIGTPATTQVATIDTLVNIFTQNYLTFDSLDFSGFNGYGIVKLRVKHSIIQHCNIYGGWFGTAGLVYGGASSDHNTVQYCYYHDIADCGMSDGYEHSQDTFQFNHVQRIGLYAGMGGSGDGHYQGSNFQGSQTYVYHNEFDTIGYWAIGYRFSNITIDKNYIHYYCFVKDDGGGIYTQSAATNNLVSNNICEHGVGALAGTGNSFAATGGNLATAAHGIYLDDQASGTTLLNNTSYDNTYGDYFLHHDNNIVMLNNTAYNPGNGKANLLIVDNDISPAPRNGLNVQGNIFVTRDTSGATLISQRNIVTILDSRYTDIDSLGTIDFNYYCRPLNDATVASSFLYDSTNGAFRYLVDLAGWQAAFHYDDHSRQSPFKPASINDFLYQSNPTDNPVTISFPGLVYIDMPGTHYIGSYTIPAWSSVVLLKVGPASIYQNYILPYQNKRVKP